MFALLVHLHRVPDVPPILSLDKKPNDLHFQAKLDEGVRNVLQDELNQTETNEQLQQRIDTRTIDDVLDNNAKDEFPSRMLAEKNVIILPEIPRATTVQPNDQNETETRPTVTKPPTRATVNELKAAVEENQIPVFSEWAQKRIEEAEKQVEQEVVNSSTMKKNASVPQKAPVLKLKGAKNYASPDCGAKIIAANSESSSTHYVLTSTKDEYLLSPCKSRIWFVVELCEAIQAEHIDLANFELFSSSPKNFSVSVSNRFPTRDWSNVGKFIANDERYVQSFDLHPQLFGKYVRVDVHSHYNSEHFCPISLFRVYGISEFEAFETENRQHPIDDIDDDDDDEETDETVKPNIFKSASDAVMSIVDTVKKAASFVKPNENKTDSNSSDILDKYSIHSQCRTPNYGLVCARCSEDVAALMANLLKCKQDIITSLLKVEIIRNSITKSQICANLVGIDFNMNCRDATNGSAAIINLTDLHSDYVSHLFPISYVAAMCNALAVSNRLYALQNATTVQHHAPAVSDASSGGNGEQAHQLDQNVVANASPSASDDVKLSQEHAPTTEPTPSQVESVVESPIAAIETSDGSASNGGDGSTTPGASSNAGTPNDSKEQPLPVVDQTQSGQHDVNGAGDGDGQANSQQAMHTATTTTTTTSSSATVEQENGDADKPAQNIFNIVAEEATNKEPSIATPTEPPVVASTEQIDSWETIDENILTMTEATVVPTSNEMHEPTDEPSTNVGWINQQPATGQKLHSESVFLRLSSRVKVKCSHLSLLI